MNRTTIGKITRLRVFNVLKRAMIVEGRVPTGPEIAEMLQISERTATGHMRALDGADGLPMRVPTRGERAGDPDTASERITNCTIAAFRGGINVDPNAIPLDILIGESV